MSKKQTSPCRLNLIFAKDTPIVVILRRGPTRWVKVIKWNTAKDTFEDGQWFHGNIFEERCSLSPNGKLFAYFAYKQGRGKHGGEGYGDTYTVVSRPPYLSALALWPSIGTYGGGGLFIDNDTLRLAHSVGHTFHPGAGNTKIFMDPLQPPHPNHLPEKLNIETHLYDYDPQLNFQDEKAANLNASWSGVDHSGRGIYTREGKLYRVVKKDEHKLLRDFNDDKVINIKSPAWAKEWP